ncbi:hypothetical protein [Raoultella ornithinolytica]|uniref:hypothetical protein n=1 Tax=Raoultella ornithinolytica TaxID=54291 RepID=UPI0025554313|nr:hypothetical protein [Raoultella ornithinolytica]MDK7651734.1 hypothetical protein [Raoultella ornithinolytica]MDK7660648.1 hypothetical protein [Raoultella ornithinolytica]
MKAMCVFFVFYTGLSSAEVSKFSELGKPLINPLEVKDSYNTGIYASRYTYGMRGNAVVAAIKANSDNPFNFPVLGFQYTKAMSKYNDRDSVALYSDNTSPPYFPWEILRDTIFTPTSVTSSSINSKFIKKGMIIETSTSPKWSGYVVSVDNNKIITSGWVNNEINKMGTPPDGVTVFVNPLTKIWASNFNVFIPENGRADKAVIQENAVVNNKVVDPQYIYGIDNVVLPQSKYGGSVAFQARSSSSGYMQKWSVGFLALGSKNANFSSSDIGTESPKTGYLEGSSAADGLVFKGRNKNSSITWLDSGKVSAKISPTGQFEKISYKTKLLNGSVTVDDSFSRYIINSEKEINITLFDNRDEPDGLTLEFVNFSGKNISFSSKSNLQVAKGLGRIVHAVSLDGVWMVY